MKQCKEVLISMVALQVVLAVACGAPAVRAESDAPSAFRCKNLEKASDIQLLEGKDGMFFRVIPDIKMFHPFTDATIDNLAKISSALKANGTTLIYVPVPTKSMILPDLLPEQAKLYGFDPVIANAIYSDIIDRMKARGVIAVDIATAMRDKPKAANGDLAFFRTDFHWTAQGAAPAALEIARRIAALPGYDGKLDLTAEPIELPAVRIQSTMHKAVQHYCRSAIPSASAHPYKFETAPIDILAETQTEPGKSDIFAASGPSGIALVGTSFSDMAIADFAGFLEHYSGLQVENHSISGGNQFGSILSYLTSREFTKTRPKFLVWENPVYNNLAQFGDAPLLEILAAAKQDCGVSLAAERQDAKSVLVDLTGHAFGEADLISADVGDNAGRKVTFEFTTSKGEHHVREVERGERLRSTGRYFLPLSDLVGADLSKVLISFDVDMTEQKSISLCRIQTGEVTQ
jgi:alginate biosynthesis protein AlgX